MPVSYQKLSLAGTLRFSELDASGKPCKWFSSGCQEDLSLSISKDIYEHIERCSGQNAIDFRKIKSQSIGVSWSLTDFSIRGLALAFSGKAIPANPTGTVTNETLCANAASFVIDDELYISHTAIAGLVLKDGANATIPAASYVLDAATGVIRVLAPFVGPVTASYTYNDPAGIAFLTEGLKNYGIIFSGINTANGAAGSLEFFKVSAGVDGDFQLQTEDIAIAKYSGTVLVDPTKPIGGALGQFGRMTGFGFQ